MKKIYILLPVMLLIPVLLLNACNFSRIAEGTTAAEEPETTSPAVPEPVSQAIETTTAEVTTVTESTTAAPVPVPSTTVPPATEATTAYYSGYVGTSANGYDITAVNGVIYVNGVLIANKSYALPQTYAPGDLTEECRTAFYEMQTAASEAGCDIYISSGYRSYSLQSSLYSRYCARDGVAAADRYSARPGYSEHQTGLAIDLNSIAYSFADTAEGQWVAANCHKYGFILRYPEGKEAQTGYRYEPWHIRYVGVDVATAVYESGLCLEEYLGIDSVYKY